MEVAWLLWTIAGAMATVIAWLVRWSSTARTVVGAAFVVFLLAMMAAMFLGTLVYFSGSGTGSAVLGLWAAGIAMSASVFPVVALVLREAGRPAREGGAAAPRPLGSPNVLFAWVLGLVLLGELLMGRSFALAAGSATAPSGAPLGGLASALGSTIASPWFLFPMAFEMGLASLWVGTRLPSPMREMLFVQPALMLLSPPALAGGTWVVASSLGATVAMSTIVAFLLYRTYRGDRLPPPVSRYAARLLVTFALTGVGLVVWASTGSLTGFAVSVIAQMAVFFSAVVVPEAYQIPQGRAEARLGSPPTSAPASS